MVFSSVTFIVFFAAVIIICLVLQKAGVGAKTKHMLLLAASYVFYGWWDPRFCLLMLGMTVIAYISSLKRDIAFFKFLGVAAPLIVLGIFKYFNFFIGSFLSVFGIGGAGALNIILPVGISFFTFQSMSYTIDVLRGKQEPVGFIDLALYIAFFPQLVAGPIVKASDFLPQLTGEKKFASMGGGSGEERKITLKGFEKGIQVFVFGLLKKIVLADNLSVFVDEVFAAPSAFNAPTLILAVVLYSLQIYFDFSGYSDMAIGSARILGYDFLPNFNIPYISKNLTEFWKRWHISLSKWLQEYLYIPLGGNRRGKARTYLNLLLTMVLGGLWHGANWTFVIWGLLHGAGLCVHKVYASRFKKNTRGTLRTAVSILLTYAFVCFCWIFFRAENFGGAFAVIRGIFTWRSGVSHMFSWSFIAIAALAAATIAPIIKKKSLECDGYYPISDLNTVKGLFILIFTLGITLSLAYIGGSPFIYFQF